MHLNHETTLPPVDCPLLIQVDGQMVRAFRPTFVEDRRDELTYELADGTLLSGKFPWTYP